MTLQAIQTRYYSPTNHREAYIKAWCMGGQIRSPYQHRFNVASNMRLAAIALKNKLQWDHIDDEKFVQGALPNGDDCFVIVEG